MFFKLFLHVDIMSINIILRAKLWELYKALHSAYTEYTGGGSPLMEDGGAISIEFINSALNSSSLEYVLRFLRQLQFIMLKAQANNAHTPPATTK